MRTLGDFSRLNARRCPHKIAARMDDEVLTFRDLDAQSTRLAWSLISGGVVQGDRVAILALNSPEFVVVAQGVAKAGAILVPINTRFVGQEVVGVLAHCGAKILFVESEFLPVLGTAVDGMETPPLLILIRSGGSVACGMATLEGYVAAMGPEGALPGVDPNSAAAIMYTSGTTGTPKGVMVSHDKYLRIFLAIAIEMEVREPDVLQLAVPLFHNGGFASVLNPALMVGATVVCHRGSFDPERILADIARHGVTVTHWVPTMLAMVTPVAKSGRYDLGTLRRIHYGAMPIAPELLAEAREVFKADFFQGYGTTDAGLISCLRPEQHFSHLGMTGRPVFNTVSRIVDLDDNDVPVGAIGEIVVAADSSGMIGYWNDEVATANAIRDGWIYTGDLARQEADGFFTIVDRKNFMIISGGENVFPVEVEAVILSHPQISEVAVFGLKDAKFGEVVCAAVVPKAGASMSLELIQEYCDGKLARYKIPRRLLILEQMPRTAIGKIAKGTLPALLSSRRV